jgi:hypothetical protein
MFSIIFLIKPSGLKIPAQKKWTKYKCGFCMVQKHLGMGQKQCVFILLLKGLGFTVE